MFNNREWNNLQKNQKNCVYQFVVFEVMNLKLHEPVEDATQSLKYGYLFICRVDFPRLLLPACLKHVGGIKFKPRLYSI